MGLESGRIHLLLTSNLKSCEALIKLNFEQFKLAFMKNIYLVFAFFALVNTAIAQEKEGKYFEVGIEIQQYPTGYLAGIRGELGLAQHHAMGFRIGYNGLDHKDFGVHDTEVGGGFGGSVGYRYYFKPDNKNLFIGVRTDIWFNKIDWTDLEPGSMDPIEASSKIVVFQPTVIGGYRWAVNDHFAITPTAALGAEINVKTDGEEVGQGVIILWGLNLSYRL